MSTSMVGQKNNLSSHCQYFCCLGNFVLPSARKVYHPSTEVWVVVKIYYSYTSLTPKLHGEFAVLKNLPFSTWARYWENLLSKETNQQKNSLGWRKFIIEKIRCSKAKKFMEKSGTSRKLFTFATQAGCPIKFCVCKSLSCFPLVWPTVVKVCCSSAEDWLSQKNLSPRLPVGLVVRKSLRWWTNYWLVRNFLFVKVENFVVRKRNVRKNI